MNAALEDLSALIESEKPDLLVDSSITYGEFNVTVALAGLVDFIEFLKSHQGCQFTTLVDITAVDYPGRAARFEIVYHFLSMYTNQRIRVRAAVRENSTVPSLCELYPAANWFEREVFDMYGIAFTDHPDMRRILTDYGFEGHPLRKDFPTTGYKELRYDELEKRCVYEPVSLVQDYRQFDFMSPWEGAEYILPGDEKQEAD